MSKFNTRTTTAAPSRSPIKVSKLDYTVTHEGADARALDAKSELFTLAVTNMVDEQTFYESRDTRDSRFVTLIDTVTTVDPLWVARMLVWLRTEANMRSAALVGAAEYVRAGGRKGRHLVASVLQRADEPGELLAYWTNKYGRNVPQPIKRGIADAITGGLYNEYSVQKYDSDARGFRFGDVIQIVHPKPVDATQDALFKYALDRRYKGNDAVPGEQLTMLRESALLDHNLRQLGVDKHGVTSEQLKSAGWTWERLSSYGAFTADTWAAIIPAMGYMALLRNLRNFEQVGVPESVMQTVRDRIADPDQVARSRQLPYRFYSALQATQNAKTRAALEQAFEHSFGNIDLPGRSLVLVDVSASMTWGAVSGRSSVTPAEIAKVMGVAAALSGESDLHLFDTRTHKVDINRGASPLTVVERLNFGGGGTNIASAICSTYSGHDRVLVFTDMQSHDNGGVNAPTYVFDLQGYGRVPDLGSNTVLFSGWQDTFLRTIPLIERGRNADWPWS